MAVPLQPVLLVVGLVLAMTGVFIYRVAMVAFGGLFGGAAGILLAIALAGDIVLFVGLGLVGMVVGILVVRQAYRMVILGAGAITGIVGGLYAAGASLSEPMTLLDPLLAVGLGVGIVAAFLLQKVLVILISAAWGASMVAIALAPPIEDVTNVQALVDAFVSDALLATFVVGIGVQVGLWIALNYYGDEENEGGLLGGLLSRDS